jgi:hypothetical protein
MTIFNTNKDIELKEVVVSCLSLEQAQASCKTDRGTQGKNKNVKDNLQLYVASKKKGWVDVHAYCQKVA